MSVGGFSCPGALGRGTWRMTDCAAAASQGQIGPPAGSRYWARNALLIASRTIDHGSGLPTLADNVSATACAVVVAPGCPSGSVWWTASSAETACGGACST